jgi:hypothetical protein
VENVHEGRMQRGRLHVTDASRRTRRIDARRP